MSQPHRAAPVRDVRGVVMTPDYEKTRDDYYAEMDRMREVLIRARAALTMTDDEAGWWWWRSTAGVGNWPERSAEHWQAMPVEMRDVFIRLGQSALIRLRDRAALPVIDPIAGRFFLARDNDSHWYVVPVLKQAAFNEWISLPEGDERGWSVPDYVQPVGGSPSQVTFTDPVIA